MKKTFKFLVGATLICFFAGNGNLMNSKIGDFLGGEKVSPCIYVNDTSEFVNKIEDNVDLQARAKSAYLMNYETTTAVYSHNENERLPIASMCKIMTLLLSFDAIKAGNLTMNEEITISERAASMGGSQVFLEANAKYPVKELIKSIVVCSANDSCVALAERLSGSESLFVDKMNEKAKEIGANNTLFANCTGLPKETQYSCAKDVAILLKNLLTHKEYYDFSKVWMDKFQHPEGRYTEITNTNKLVRFYDGCDGGKTGFTNEAGYCLAATAMRNGMRMIAVVIGEENSANRFEDVKMMFNYAFANYVNKEVVQGEVALENPLLVSGGKTKFVQVYPASSAYSFEKRGSENHLTTEIISNEVKAPIEKGEVVGEIVLFKNGVECDRVPLLAAENVKRANIFDKFREIARSWNA